MSKKLNRSSKFLIVSLVFLLLWILAVKLITYYTISNIDSNWNEIVNDKIAYQKKEINNTFENYLKVTNEISDRISSNLNIKKFVNENNSQKVFESLTNMFLSDQMHVEIYDRKYQLIAFKGRQLETDNFSIDKVLNKAKFSIIKNIGFYTYLIIYSPIYDISDENSACGICVTASLIDVKYQIKNKFFPDYGISHDIKNKLNINIDVLTTDAVSYNTSNDSLVLKENYYLDLIGVDKNILGRIFIPEYDKQIHTRNIENYAQKINSLIVFFISILLIVFYFKISSYSIQRKYILLKIILFSILLFLLRILWVEFEFPSVLIGTDVFGTQYYASRFNFGLAKSIGELFISVLFLFSVILYISYLLFGKNFFTSKYVYSRSLIFISKNIFVILFLLTTVFVSFNLLGLVIKSLVYDSNIKFFDKSNIIPTLDLFFVQITILLVVFIFILFNSNIILFIYLRIKGFITSLKYKKILYLFLFFTIQSLNFIFDFIYKIEISFRLRFLIIFTLFILIFYLYKYSFLARKINILNFRCISLIVLSCIVITPVLLLEKIKYQESEFVEILGKSLMNQEDERALFLISNELLNFSLNRNLETMIFEKNKLPKFAFYLWKESKLNTENFNSAVIFIDTNKKVLSDFNISPLTLETDSLVNYASKYYIKKYFNFSPLDEEVQDTSVIMKETIDDEIYPMGMENSNILKNANENYYLGIIPVERKIKRNSRTNPTIGFILIALQPDVKNIIPQPPQQIFKNYPKDNILNKLTSKPIISEFTSDDIESSSDIEITKEIQQSVPGFISDTKNKGIKKEWIESNINNEIYNTFFIYTLMYPDGGIKNNRITNEKVSAITLKSEKYSFVLFFYLKFVLFTALVYLIIYIIYAFAFSYKLKLFKPSFRNKLFFTFLIISLIPLFILGIYTRTFIIKKNDGILQSQIESDLNFANDFVEAEKRNTIVKNSQDSITKIYKNAVKKYFIKSDKNFNLFSGLKLAATTNDELFKSDLLDTRIDADAYYNIFFSGKDKYTKVQNIGSFSFIEGYKPLLDKKGKYAGILSSLSVYKQNEISEELTETLTYIFGSYILVIILLLILVTYFTEKLYKPISILTNATERISKGVSNIELNIDREDEFGTLVKSFNRMSRDLEKSKNELKKAEREAAWRDIARRVAHEIKNPLTPMKLSIQHLESIYKSKNGKNDFESILNKTKELIVGEIDKLNRIATEFSRFAKLPVRNYEPIDVNEILKDMVTLYSSVPNILIKGYLNPELPLISADKQEINRVFQNLIKNAIQSVNKTGNISIKSYNQNGYVFIEIQDDGCGMDDETLEKLFEPNFSTKSTGMGLGLAITKKSLDDMGASINFESKIDFGTKVIIKFNQIEQ